VRYPVENNSPTVDGVDLSVRFNASNDVDGIRGIVFSPSGKVKISQTMYITVGDGRHVAGQWIIHRASRLVNGSVSQEIGPANQITLKINRYTAHNSYVTPPDYVDGWHVE